jgi:complement component 1 Q subcomponent-binding protein
MSAIRSLRQLSLSTSRIVAARSSCATSTARRLPALAARVSAPATRAFSVSARSFAEGSSDVVLSQKLAEELQYEKTAAADVAEPEFLKSFKEQGVWAIEDVAGNDEVTLSRKFGNENIRLMFSIADIQSQEEDPAFADEEEGEEPASEDEPIHTYGIRVAFSVTKSNGPGAINVDTVCQEGSFMVDAISFYKDARIGTELSAEADWKRRGLYIGPQFDTLDVSVQEEFEKYLQERGINESLALFIPEYAEYKEQKEYLKWLENVKSFVDL